MTLSFAKVAWFNTTKGYGVAGLRLNGATIGIHRNAGRFFYRGTDSAELRLAGRRLITDPKEGDDICLVEGRRSRSGNRCAEVWAFADDYDEANTEIFRRYERLQIIEGSYDQIQAEARCRLELLRLRCNPKFRLIEQEHYLGNPTSKAPRFMFEGTKGDLIVAVNPPQRSGKLPLVVTSGKLIDGYRYMRYFQRETATDWKDCDNPLTMQLPPMPEKPDWSFEEAQHVLKEAKIYRAPSGLVGIGFHWRVGLGEVAHSNCEEVFVRGDEFHEGTWFKCGEAEYLWEIADRSHIDQFRGRSEPRYQPY